MRNKPACAFLLMLGSCVHSPDRETLLMQSIEQGLQMPEGAFPVPHYRRHYAWALGKSDVIDAVYLKGGRAARLWLSADDMPIVLDGGCSVVTFSYDTRRHRAEAVRCN